jgi:hypothetical protein
LHSIKFFVRDFFESNELGLEVVIVDDLGAVSSRVEHPDVKDALQEIETRKEE